MRKVLMHAGLSPLDRPDMDEVFEKHLFSSNSGNLLFQYSAYRTMMTEDTEFISALLEQKDIPDAFFERVNGECECALLPMSNNFRRDYNLKRMTESVRKLRIPCVVTGIGLQAKSVSQIRDGFPFDGDARAFVSAVLDHSAMLGLRGEMTAEYLKHLGFSPERHFTVTGCPSLYARGGRLPEARKRELTPESPVAINYRKEQSPLLFGIMHRAMAEYPHYRLLFQRIEELFLLRYGHPIYYDYRMGLDDKKAYPRTLRDPAIRGGHAIGFANAPAWLDFMAGMDFSFGCRIHGNISALLAGTPAVVFTIDTRTEEICRYHNIPFIPADRLDENLDLRELYEKTDFDSVHRGHEARFRHYVDFLNANGLRHIYQDSIAPENPPLDRAVAATEEWGRIELPRFLTPARRLKGLSIRWPRIKGKILWRLKHIGK